MKKTKYKAVPSLILKQTKDYIQDRNKYTDFILNQNDSLMKTQYPYLTSREILKSTIDNKPYDTPLTEREEIKHVDFKRVFRNKRHHHSMDFNKISLPVLTSTPFVLNDNNGQRSFRSLNWFYNKRFRMKKNCEEKTQERYHNDIFDCDNYSSTQYNEADIFNHKAEIRELIEDRVCYFKRNPNSNQVTKFTKEIKVKDNQFLLRLDSLKVNFIDQETNVVVFNFVLPFAILPLFYYKGIEYFKQMLVSIIKFRSGFEKIEVEEKNLYFFLNNKREMKRGFTLSGNYFNNFNSHNFSNISLKGNLNKVEIKEPTQSFSDAEEIYYNEYMFSWSTPKRNYIVQVVLPKTYLEETKMNISVEHYVDYELLFYLYKKNFLFWDFYILKYLFSFKVCRKVFDAVLSKTKKVKIVNNVIELKAKKVKDYNIKSNSMTFLSTNEFYENIYNEIQSLKFKLYTKDIKGGIDYDSDNSSEGVITMHQVYLNFAQARNLFIGIDVMTDGIKDILIKFCDIKGNKVEFNYNLFNSMSKEFWINLQREYKDKVSEIKNNDNMNINVQLKEETKNNKIKLEIVPPMLIRTYIKVRGTNEQSRSFISGDFEKIMNQDMIIWSKHFNKEHSANAPETSQVLLFMRHNSNVVQKSKFSPKRGSQKE